MQIICKIVLVVQISLFMTSCDYIRNENKIKSTVDIKNSPDRKESNFLGFLDRTDTLKIMVEFSECGEWGGRKESIFLRRDENNKVIARLIVDSIPCDNIITKYDKQLKQAYSDLDDKERVVIIDIEKTLSETDEKSINNFIIQLLEIYLKNDYLQRNDDSLFIYTDSGTVLQVINTNLTLNLSFINIDNYANTQYGSVRNQIFN